MLTRNQEMSHKTVERKRYFIHRNYQGTFLFQLLLLVIFFNLLLIGAGYYFFDLVSAQAVSSGVSGNAQFMHFLSSLQSELIVSMVALSFVVSMVILLFGIWHSHKVAGPVEKLQIALESLVDQQRPEEIQFRQTDYFHELAEIYNQYIKKLER